MKNILGIFGFLLLTFTVKAETVTTQQFLEKINLNQSSGIFSQNKACSSSYQVEQATGVIQVITKSQNFPNSTLRISPPFEITKEGNLLSFSGKIVGSENDTFVISYNLNNESVFQVYALDGKFETGCVNDKTPTDSAKANHGIEVLLMSNGGRHDQNAENIFYKILGKNIADRTLDQFVITGNGDEGGHKYCLSINSNFEGQKLKRVQDELLTNLSQAIVPNPGTTFKVSLKKDCK
ncbi:MAG: hypothetical protein Q7U04_02310 [Bacteriovorax sp.]|nr:hypothetical protein [Bacteriovorax sp.]